MGEDCGGGLADMGTDRRIPIELTSSHGLLRDPSSQHCACSLLRLKILRKMVLSRTRINGDGTAKASATPANPRAAIYF